MSETPDWLRLQKKIFTRWVNQKLVKRMITVNDVVADIKDGTVLIALLEELSEKKYPNTKEFENMSKAKVRAQLLDNANNALKFTWDCGVEMKMKPSAEDVVDGDEKNILGLVWAIMLKFIKIGDEDDEEQLNAKDALMLWVKNKTAGYANVNVENFKKSFHDGLALCAIIHKHRPKLVDFDSLNPENKIQNLQTAIEAAEKYFGLEKYLSPEDIPKLDENSMVIYVSDYYYGIAEQRKLDLAARRIGKVIKFTKENDALRAEYKQIASKLKEHIEQVKKILDDETIHNTMAGAKKRLEEFYAYKGKDKNEIIADDLTLEGIFNNLSMRLKAHKRPDFVPEAGTSLQDFSASIQHLEDREKFQNIALHAELNRQIKLVKLDEQHKSIFEKIKKWVGEKEAYLKKKEVINSVSEAQLQLRLLDAYEKESQAVHETTISELKKIGEELSNEKYENIETINSRQSEVDKNSVTLEELCKAKRPVLDDDLAREQFKEKVMLMEHEHHEAHSQLQGWIESKENYLNKKEEINSVTEAQTQIALLEAFRKEKKKTEEGKVVEHKQLGEEILAQKYETQYSSYVWHKPDEIKGRFSFVEDKFKNLDVLADSKKKVLDEDLAREQEKERLRLEFAHRAAEFTRWTKDTAEKLALTQFGFTLEEIEAFQSQLDQDNSKLQSEAGKMKSEAESTHEQMTKMNVTENAYTKLTLDDLNAAKGELDTAIESRNTNYKEVLDRVRADDALCKEFADLAEPFSKRITETKDKINKSTSELEDQLKFVDECIANKGSIGSELPKIKEKEEEIKSRGITQNRHTSLNAQDVDVQFKQYELFLEKKKQILDAEVEHKNLRGISKEDFKEIEENFKQFDADNSGNIDKKELKACLYSLGEEKSKSEIEAIMKEYGNGTNIDYERFKDLMITIYGDTDTKDEILNGFKLINRGEEIAKEDKMELVMATDDLSYIKETAPAKEGGYDFTAWTEDVFSR